MAYICHHQDPVNGTPCKSQGPEEQACPWSLAFYRETSKLLTRLAFGRSTNYEADEKEAMARLRYVPGTHVWMEQKQEERKERIEEREA